ncbi:uncharacterized protein LOC135071354 [Ostrinia nubilalis]|uniref:uncharacterized protein LOC135071354 n=1 Tax=Ostrinia nubilalis TaxID=29057 RepID=UPI0030824C91
MKRLKYHLGCVNIQKSLKELTEEYKSGFTCPCCRSKLPKSDNTNTPIRSSGQQASECDLGELSSENVNYRRGTKPLQKNTTSVTTENIRQIIKEELENVLDGFRISILKEFELKTKEVLERFNHISDTLKGIEGRQEGLKKEIDENSNSIRLLITENTALKDTVADLNARVTRMEQHSRASNLEIQNVPEYKSENLNTIVKQIAAITDCKLEETDIQLCTRIAKVNNESRRPRSIIIKFNSQKARDNLLAATLKFNKKSKSLKDKLNTSHLGIGGDIQSVFVVEHLSPAQKALHAAARFKARELNYKFVWRLGLIVAVLIVNSLRVGIVCTDEIAKHLLQLKDGVAVS